jgi:hypothetical protein
MEFMQLCGMSNQHHIQMLINQRLLVLIPPMIYHLLELIVTIIIIRKNNCCKAFNSGETFFHAMGLYLLLFVCLFFFVIINEHFNLIKEKRKFNRMSVNVCVFIFYVKKKQKSVDVFRHILFLCLLLNFFSN